MLFVFPQGQKPQALPNGHAQEILEQGLEERPDSVQNLVEVSLTPAEAAAVPDEAFGIGARRHAAGAAEEAAEAGAEFLAAAFVGEEATFAAFLVLQLFYFDLDTLFVLFSQVFLYALDTF